MIYVLWLQSPLPWLLAQVASGTRISDTFEYFASLLVASFVPDFEWTTLSLGRSLLTYAFGSYLLFQVDCLFDWSRETARLEEYFASLLVASFVPNFEWTTLSLGPSLLTYAFGSYLAFCGYLKDCLFVWSGTTMHMYIGQEFQTHLNISPCFWLLPLCPVLSEPHFH